MKPEKKHLIISRALKAVATKHDELSYNELRVIIALERLVARLESDEHLAKHLIFKGGFVLLKIIESNRFTRDLDALAFEISKEEVPKFVEKAIMSNLHDGLWYGDIKIKELQGHSREGALRFDCAFQIGEPEKRIHKLSRIHLDIGFGDIVDPDIKSKKMKSIIPGEKPVSWLVYPIEYIISEKLQTLFHRGSANSRAKDIYDLVLLLPKAKNKTKLKKAIQQTFEVRNTPLENSFYRSAKEFDLTILRHAWTSVQLLSATETFEKNWELLLDYLKPLDEIMEG